MAEPNSGRVVISWSAKANAYVARTRRGERFLREGRRSRKRRAN